MLDLELNDHARKKPEGAMDAKLDRPAPAPPQARTKPLWAAFAVLVAVLAAAAGYGYRQLQKQHIPLGQLPEMLQSVAAIQGRVDAMEANLRTWTADWTGLAQRVGKLERQTNVNLHLARKHAERLTAKLEERLQEQMDARAYLVDNRLQRVESAQASEHAQLAQLQKELAEARQALAEARQQTGRDLAGVHQQINDSQRQVSAVAEKLERQRVRMDRVDFEAVRHRTYELARGISLHITRTNARYQRYKGWVRLAPEGRTLWVMNEGTDQPLVFYRPPSGERCELVVTRVARDSVVGYLSLPADQGESASAPVADLATAPSPSGAQ